MEIGWLIMQIQEIETPTRFDALVFDFDGVLVESTDIKTMAFATLYKHHGQAIVEKVTSYHAKHAGISRFKNLSIFKRIF